MHSTHENTLTHVLAYASELQHSALQVVQDGFTGGIISLFCEGKGDGDTTTTNKNNDTGCNNNNNIKSNVCDIMPTPMSLYTLSNFIIEGYFVPSHTASVENETTVYNYLFDGTWRDLFTLIILIFPDCFAQVKRESSYKDKKNNCWYVCADEVDKDELRQEGHSQIISNNIKKGSVAWSQETNTLGSTLVNTNDFRKLLDLNVNMSTDNLTQNVEKQENSVVYANKIISSSSLSQESIHRGESFFELASDDCTILELGSLQTMAEHRFHVGLLLLASINNTLHDVQVRIIRENYKSNTFSNKTKDIEKTSTLEITRADFRKENKNEKEEDKNINLHVLTKMSSLRNVERLVQRAKIMLLSCLCVSATSIIVHTSMSTNECCEEFEEEIMHEVNDKKINLLEQQKNLEKHASHRRNDINKEYKSFVLLTGGQFAKSVEEWGWLLSDSEYDKEYDNLLNRINSLFLSEWKISSKRANETRHFEIFLKEEYDKLFNSAKQISPFTSPLAYHSKNASRGVFFDYVSEALCTPALPSMPVYSGELTYLLPSSAKSNTNDFVMCETLSELQTLLSKCTRCKLLNTEEETLFANMLPQNSNTELETSQECTLLSFFIDAVHINGFLKHNPHVLAHIVRWCCNQRKSLQYSDKQKPYVSDTIKGEEEMEVNMLFEEEQVPSTSIYLRLEYKILNQVLNKTEFDVNVGYFLQELATINALQKHTFINWITEMVTKQKLATPEHSVGNIVISLINYILISCRWEKDAELLKLYANLRLEIRRHSSM